MKRLYFLIVVALTLGGCANKVSFQSSSVVPSARGDVKVKEDKNNNHVIKVDVEHLAEPGRLDDPKDVYVVWMETQGNGVKNLGLLKPKGNLKASLEAVTPFEPQKFFITAEEQAYIQYPGNTVIMETNMMKN